MNLGVASINVWTVMNTIRKRYYYVTLEYFTIFYNTGNRSLFCKTRRIRCRLLFWGHNQHTMRKPATRMLLVANNSETALNLQNAVAETRTDSSSVLTKSSRKYGQHPWYGMSNGQGINLQYAEEGEESNSSSKCLILDPSSMHIYIICMACWFQRLVACLRLDRKSAYPRFKGQNVPIKRRGVT